MARLSQVSCQKPVKVNHQETDHDAYNHGKADKIEFLPKQDTVEQISNSEMRFTISCWGLGYTLKVENKKPISHRMSL